MLRVPRPHLSVLGLVIASCATWSACSAPSSAPGGAASDVESAAASDANSTEDAVGSREAPDCLEARRRGDGGCCADGMVWDGVDACVPVGPAGCEGMPLDELSTCVPRWCWDWLSGEGTCDAGEIGCYPAGRPCTEDELAAGAGCPAGTWPRPGAAETCMAAGADEASMAAVATTPSWCWDALDDAGAGCEPYTEGCSVTPRRCSAAERAAGAGCLAGQWPAPGHAGVCVAAGALSWPPSEDGEPPPAQPPTWCLQRMPAGCDWRQAGCATSAVPCGGPETGCEAGSLPGTSGACEPAPGPGGCPPGFVADGEACTPDPACGGSSGDPPHDLRVGGPPELTLDAALGLAGTGEVIHIDPGEHAISVPVPAGVELRGHCAAQVTLNGTVSVVGTGPPVIVSRLRISNESGSGIEVSGGGRVIIRDAWVHATRGVGVEARDAGSQAELYRSVVSAVAEVDGDDTPEAGIVARDGASIVAHAVRVTAATLRGVRVEGVDTAFEAVGLRVDGILPDAAGDSGEGISVVDGAAASGRGWFLSKNHRRGLMVSGEGAALEVTGLLVQDGVPQASDGSRGYGVGLTGGASVSLAALHVRNNWRFGVVADAAGTELALEDVLIDDTKEDLSYGGLGYGLNVVFGARATARRFRIRDSTQTGVVVAANGASINLADGVIEATRAASTGHDGNGLFMGQSGIAEVAGVWIHEAHAIGVSMLDVGTEGRLAGVRVSATQPRVLDQNFGYGLQVNLGGSLEVAGSAVIDNHACGTAMQGAGSELRLIGVTVRDTKRPAGSAYPPGGLEVAAGHAELIATEVSGHHRSILVVGAAATLNAADLRVVDSVAEAATPEVPGVGISAQSGGTVVLDVARLDQVLDLGVVAHAGGSLVASDLVVTDMAWDVTDGTGGTAIAAADGGQLVLTGASVSGSLGAGVAAQHGTVTAAGARVEDTLPAWSHHDSGFGVVTSATGDAYLSGCWLSGNHFAGLFCEQVGSTLTGHGVIAEDTLPIAEDAAFGIGAWARSASLALTASVVQNSHGAGVLVQQGTASLVDTVVTGVVETLVERRAAEPVDHADGVIVASGTATMERAVIADCERAAILAVASVPDADHTLLCTSKFGAVVDDTLVFPDDLGYGNAEHGIETSLGSDLGLGLGLPPDPDPFTP